MNAKSLLNKLKTPSYTEDRNIEPEHASLVKIYEDDLDDEIRKWTTRREFKQSIGKSKIGSKIKTIFISIMKHGSNKTLTFTPREFIFMFLFYHLNLNHVMLICKLFNVFGLLFTLTLLIFIGIFIEMPLMMYIIFFCSYSKKLCLNFFECVPIMKGLAFSFMIVFMLVEGRNVALAVLTSEFIDYVVYNKIWDQCPYDLNFTTCIPANTNITHNLTCSEFHTSIPDNQLFSTQYLVTNVLLNWAKFTQLQPAPIIFRIMVWSAILITSVVGLSWLKKFYIRMQILCLISFLFIGCIVLFTRLTLHPTAIILYSPVFKTLTPFHIFTIINTSLQFHGIPFAMWISTMKPSSLNPQTAAIYICFFKCIALIWIACLYGIGALSVIERYKFINVSCVHLGARDALLAVVPDILMMLSLPKVLLLFWLCPIFVLTIIYGTYVVSVIVDTTVQWWDKLEKYRSILTILFCSGFAIFNQMKVLDDYLHIYYLQNMYYSISMVNKANMCFFAIAMHFLYTPVRFKDDFLFLYDYPPNKFWSVMWIYIPYITLIMCFYLFGHNLYGMHGLYHDSIHFGFITILLIIGPVIAIASMKIFMMLVRKTIQNVNTPHPNWGPPDRMYLLMRKYYFSKRDTRIRRRGNRQSTCRHKCYLQSLNYDVIINRQYEALEEIEDSPIRSEMY